MVPEKSSPLLLERYELKYHIHHDLVEPISQYIESMGCYLDRYAEADKTYTINSLYLDSPNFLFLRRTLNGDDRRFNMRIRSYGDNPVGPYFLEVKFKESGFVRKFRCPISKEIWDEHFEGLREQPVYSEIDVKSKNFSIFERLASMHAAEPKILTQYRRKAYLSEIDDYARVTFDMNLKYCDSHVYNVDPSRVEMKNYDNPLKFSWDANVILELKCTAQVPFWIMDLIKYFNLERGSFSKYGSSVEEMLFHQYPQRIDRSAMQSALLSFN